MSAETPPAVDPAFIARVKGIIVQPKLEWEQIEHEPATIKGLFTRYAMILAAIGPVAVLIGSQLFPMRVLGTVYGAPIIGAILGAVVSYVLTLVSAFVLGLVIDALASSFGGTPNRVQSMKVAVYSMTAAWLAGIFGLIPALAILSIVGLYSLYLLYLGLPRLMKVPQDKAAVYTIVVVIAALVIWAIVGAITGTIAAGFMMGAGAAGPVV